MYFQILGQAVAAGAGIPQLVIQGGSFAAFIWVVHWMMGNFSKGQEEIREQHAADSAVQQRAQAATTLAIVTVSRQMLMLDMKVSGIAPDPDEDPRERESQALIRYDDILKSMTNIESTLSEKITSPTK